MRYVPIAILTAALSMTSIAAWAEDNFQMPQPKPGIAAPQTKSEPEVLTFKVPARTAYVIDGDTFYANKQPLRIFGIDAPEAKQTCRIDEAEIACGLQAAGWLNRYLRQHSLTCEKVDKDRYNRDIVRCKTSGGADLAEQMVSAGMAVAFLTYSHDYLPAEKEAKANKVGIWATEFEMPAEWRNK